MARFWDFISKSRSLDWLGRVLVSVPTFITVVWAYIEPISWTYRFAFVAGVVWFSLWLWLNWASIKQKIFGEPAGSSETSGGVSPQIIPQPEPEPKAVTMTLDGLWDGKPLRFTRLSEIGHHPERLAEDVVLRMTAQTNLKNVLVKVKLYRGKQFVAELKQVEGFSGNVPRGIAEEILLYRSEFENVPIVYTDPRTNTQEPLMVRRVIENSFFPLTDSKCVSTKNESGPYHIKVEVFHEDGPDTIGYQLWAGMGNVPHTRIFQERVDQSITIAALPLQ